MIRPIKIKKNNGSPPRDKTESTEDFLKRVKQELIDGDKRMEELFLKNGTSLDKLAYEANKQLKSETEELKKFLDDLEADNVKLKD